LESKGWKRDANFNEQSSDRWGAGGTPSPTQEPIPREAVN